MFSLESSWHTINEIVGTSCTKTKENIHQSLEETVNKNISGLCDYNYQ